MKCRLFQKEKSKDAKITQEIAQKAVNDYFTKKMTEMSVREYILKNSWDENDYNEKLEHYKQTGELPPEIFK